MSKVIMGIDGSIVTVTGGRGGGGGGGCSIGAGRGMPFSIYQRGEAIKAPPIVLEPREIAARDAAAIDAAYEAGRRNVLNNGGREPEIDVLIQAYQVQARQIEELTRQRDKAQFEEGCLCNDRNMLINSLTDLQNRLLAAAICASFPLPAIKPCPNFAARWQDGARLDLTS